MNTTAARYQNLSINQTKLSGQCGRLKCCLNYELDTYMDALSVFPDHADHLETVKGVAHLQKRDIFKNLMWYSYSDNNKQYPLSITRVKEIQKINKLGQKADDLQPVELETRDSKAGIKPDMGYVNDVGQITLKNLEKNKKKKRSGGGNKERAAGGPQQGNRPQGPRPQQAAGAEGQSAEAKTPQQNRPQQGGNRQGGNRPQQPRNPNQPQKQGQPKPQQHNRPRPQGNAGDQPAAEGGERPQQQRPPRPQGNANGPAGDRPPQQQRPPRPPRPQRPNPRPDGEQPQPRRDAPQGGSEPKAES